MFPQMQVSQADSLLRIPKTFTTQSFFQRPIRYSTQSTRPRYHLPKTHASQRARPVNSNTVGNTQYGREQHPSIPHLQVARPPIEYPKVRPGDPPLRDAVRTIFPKAQYQVGWIVRAPLHEEDHHDGANPRSKYISASTYSFVHTKPRIFIVLAKHHSHYLAVPLYTHNGAGLDHKPNQDEFVYVHDKDRVTRPPLQQRKNGHLDAAIDLRTRIPLYRPKSAAHLNYVVARSYALKVEYQGRLTRDSVEKLLEIAKAYLTDRLTVGGSEL